MVHPITIDGDRCLRWLVLLALLGAMLFYLYSAILLMHHFYYEPGVWIHFSDPLDVRFVYTTDMRMQEARDIQFRGMELYFAIAIASGTLFWTFYRFREWAWWGSLALFLYIAGMQLVAYGARGAQQRDLHLAMVLACLIIVAALVILASYYRSSDDAVAMRRTDSKSWLRLGAEP